MIDLTALFFYLFSAVLLGAAIMVVNARNTVHSVLFLILAFFNAAGLFVIAHAEFLAMMLLIVYVGAVAVLFLFVVMMLNLDMKGIQDTAKQYGLIGGIIGGVMLAELIFVVISWASGALSFEMRVPQLAIHPEVSNAQALGEQLYTRYLLAFQGAGLILLVAMIGAIVLTHRKREGVRRQRIKDQVGTTPADTIQLVDIKREVNERGSEV